MYGHYKKDERYIKHYKRGMRKNLINFFTSPFKSIFLYAEVLCKEYNLHCPTVVDFRLIYSGVVYIGTDLIYLFVIQHTLCIVIVNT